MQLPAILMFSIALAIGLVGILFLFFPDRIRTLEGRLNARWGDREVIPVRIGIDAERAIEQVYWNRRIWPARNARPKPRLSQVIRICSRGTSPKVLFTPLKNDFFT